MQLLLHFLSKKELGGIRFSRSQLSATGSTVNTPSAVIRSALTNTLIAHIPKRQVTSKSCRLALKNSVFIIVRYFNTISKNLQLLIYIVA